MTVPVVPPPKVQVYFDLSGTVDDFFVLNHATKGQLDNVTYTLAGALAVDVTDQVSLVRVSRGRMRGLDEFAAGSCEVVFRNEDRTFDPNYSASPYVGQIRPGKQVDVSAIGAPIFSGKIRDWIFEYGIAGPCTATIAVTDALGDLATKEFDAWSTTPQAAGARIEAVLDRAEVGFGANRQIDAGAETLQGDNVSHGSNVLNYLQLVARTDQGRLFGGKDGTLIYYDRTAIPTNPILFSDNQAPAAAIPYVEIGFEYGSQFLYNRVTVDREGGTAQTVTNDESVDEFGTRALSITGLLLESDARSEELANYLVNLYSNPELRVTTLTVEMGGVFINLWETVLAIEIGRLIQVEFNPPHGASEQVDFYGIVEGISHELTPMRHRITFNIGAADTRTFLVLDDTVLGRLDAGNLLSF